MAERAGAPILLMVVAAMLGVGLAASAYLNYYQYEQAGQNTQQLNSELTDLRYQLGQDQRVASAKTTPSPSADPSPMATPAVLGVQSVALSQLGVRLTTGAPIADLTYAYEPVSSLAVAQLTTASLVAKYPACRPGALGMIVRRPPGSHPATSASRLIKTIGEFTFYYVPASTNCGGDTAGRATVVADQAALINTVLPTLSQ